MLGYVANGNSAWAISLSSVIEIREQNSSPCSKWLSTLTITHLFDALTLHSLRLMLCFVFDNRDICTGELGYDGPLDDGFLHMTDDMLGPSPMHIKYSSYVHR